MQGLSKHVPNSAHVLFGAAVDASMGDSISITLVSALPENKLISREEPESDDLASTPDLRGAVEEEEKRVEAVLEMEDTPEQEELIRRCLQLAAAYRAQEDMLRVGLYQAGSDPLLDKAVSFWPQLQTYLQQSATSGVDILSSRSQLADILQPR